MASSQDGLRRRRKPQSDYHVEDDGFEDESSSLLGSSPPSKQYSAPSSSSSSSSSSSNSTAVSSSPSVWFCDRTPPSNFPQQDGPAYSLSYGLEYIWVSILYLPNTFNSLLTPVMSLLGNKMDPEVERRIRDEIVHFREHVNQCYDASSQDHESCLKLLWDLGFPNQPLSGEFFFFESFSLV